MQVGFLNLLTIVFVLLKAFHMIDWSWWWVFMPTIASFVIGLILIAVLIGLAVLKELAK